MGVVMLLRRSLSGHKRAGRSAYLNEIRHVYGLPAFIDDSVGSYKEESVGHGRTVSVGHSSPHRLVFVSYTSWGASTGFGTTFRANRSSKPCGRTS